MSETIKILSPEEYPEAFAKSFSRIFNLEGQLDALKAAHIEPVAEERTAAWRDLKASTGIDRKDLELGYKLYKRLRIAQEMEDEAKGEQVIRNVRRVFQTLRPGEMVNWLDVIMPEGANDEVAQHDEPPLSAEAIASILGDDDDEIDDAEGEPAAEPIAASEDQVVGPDADWGEDQAPAETDAAHDDAGFAFQAGEEAGFAGRPLKELLKENGGKHHLSAWGRAAKAGWEKGAKRAAEAPATAALTDEAPIGHDEGYAIAQAGNEAGEQGLPLSDNPWPEGSERAKRWASAHEGGSLWRQNGSAMPLPTQAEPVALFAE